MNDNLSPETAALAATGYAQRAISFAHSHPEASTVYAIVAVASELAGLVAAVNTQNALLKEQGELLRRQVELSELTSKLWASSALVISGETQDE